MHYEKVMVNSGRLSIRSTMSTYKGNKRIEKHLDISNKINNSDITTDTYRAIIIENVTLNSTELGALCLNKLNKDM